MVRNSGTSIGEYICLCLTCPCWAPFVCIMLWRDRRKKSKFYVRPKTKKEEALFPKRRVDNTPETLPVSRPRSLTLPLSPPSLQRKWKGKEEVVVQRTIDQLESSILYRLPLEIRTMVWEYALGGNHIHITCRRKRLGHAICPNPGVAVGGGKDLCTESRDGYGFWKDTEYPKKRSPLSLLKTCRQIYSEAIDILYSRNTFSFNNLDAVSWFQSTVLLCRFKVIQSVEFIWEFQQSPYEMLHLNWPGRPPNDRGTWERTCDILATMDSLRSLVVIADMRGQRNLTTASFNDFNPRLLEPLCKIHVKGTFEVFVTWPEHHPAEVEIASRGVPFQIRRLAERQIAWVEVEVPFDVHCLHCPDKRIIRKGSRGMANRSTEHDSAFITTQKYWLAHTYCGGWIEFSHSPDTGEDFVTQGAERVCDNSRRSG